jgi:hypothetical protein
MRWRLEQIVEDGGQRERLLSSFAKARRGLVVILVGARVTLNSSMAPSAARSPPALL